MKQDSYKQLDELLKIAEKIANAKIPDSMKESIFDIFVKGMPRRKQDTQEQPQNDGNGGNGGDFEFPSNMKRHMRQHKVTEKQVASVFFLEPGGIDYLINELDAKNNVEGLRKCIMLVGLKNALETNAYRVPLNQVRELAGNMGVLDAANFSAYMKKNADILKSYKAGEDTELSGPGIKAAIEFLKSLATE